MGDTNAAHESAQIPTVTVIADSAEWRVMVANWAFRFFSLNQDPAMAELIGKTINPKVVDYWCVSDFTKYLVRLACRETWAS
jgi:hypothetical protein